MAAKGITEASRGAIPGGARLHCAAMAGGLDADFLLHGLVWYAVLLFSLTVHEAAHAWAALRGGDPTAYLGGQIRHSEIRPAAAGAPGAESAGEAEDANQGER